MPAPLVLDTIAPGTSIRCTVLKMPRAAAKVDTITRLMQMNPAVKKDLRKAHRRRQQTLNVYIRGNRNWTSRVRCGDFIVLKTGESWTMPFDHSIAPDLASVGTYLTIEKA